MTARRAGAALVLLLAITAAFPAPVIVDVVTGAGVDFAEQTRPLPYLLGAPLFGVWDALSLLTLSQHYAVLATLVALWAASVSRSGRLGDATRPIGARVGREVVRAGVALGLLLAFYAAGTLLPRPMTGIRLDDPDRLTVDFHSHTQHSHDGWGFFTAARNRAWHEAGGFDAAYVTDHYTWAGVDEAAADNPARAGERTVLLEGAEIRIHLRPTNILGDRSRYLGALDADTVYMDPDALAVEVVRSGRPATLLYTMPGGLQYVVPHDEVASPAGVVGIEVVDGSPRGLEQVRAERERILAKADSFDLALIGAANLHGWGRTVASWSVMAIPGWQDMTPGELANAIELVLHRDRRDAVQVLERRMPYHDGSPIRVVLTLPWLAIEHFRMLALEERAAWLLWIALGWGAFALRRRTPAGASA